MFSEDFLGLRSLPDLMVTTIRGLLMATSRSAYRYMSSVSTSLIEIECEIVKSKLINSLIAINFEIQYQHFIKQKLILVHDEANVFPTNTILKGTSFILKGF